MAGNMWEWTIENCAKTNESNDVLIYRGGDYDNYASITPASSRDKHVDGEFVNVGFRVVLYK